MLRYEWHCHGKYIVSKASHLSKSSLTIRPMKMGAVKVSETSALNYFQTLRNGPENRIFRDSGWLWDGPMWNIKSEERIIFFLTASQTALWPLWPFFRRSSDQGVKLTTHLQLMERLTRCVATSTVLLLHKATHYLARRRHHNNII